MSEFVKPRGPNRAQGERSALILSGPIRCRNTHSKRTSTAANNGQHWGSLSTKASQKLLSNRKASLRQDLMVPDQVSIREYPERSPNETQQRYIETELRNANATPDATSERNQLGASETSSSACCASTSTDSALPGAGWSCEKIFWAKLRGRPGTARRSSLVAALSLAKVPK